LGFFIIINPRFIPHFSIFGCINGKRRIPIMIKGRVSSFGIDVGRVIINKRIALKE